MKGLTPEEEQVLRGFAVDGWLTDAEAEIAHDLREQGRAIREDDPESDHYDWRITSAGREALRLWPLVKAAMERSR